MKHVIVSQVEYAGYNPAVDGAERGESDRLSEIIVYGVDAEPAEAHISCRTDYLPFTYDAENKVDPPLSARLLPSTL